MEQPKLCSYKNTSVIGLKSILSTKFDTPNNNFGSKGGHPLRLNLYFLILLLRSQTVRHQAHNLTIVGSTSTYSNKIEEPEVRLITLPSTQTLSMKMCY